MRNAAALVAANCTRISTANRPKLSCSKNSSSKIGEHQREQSRQPSSGCRSKPCRNTSTRATGRDDQQRQIQNQCRVSSIASPPHFLLIRGIVKPKCRENYLAAKISLKIGVKCYNAPTFQKIHGGQPKWSSAELDHTTIF